jgi:hypothetical protein
MGVVGGGYLVMCKGVILGGGVKHIFLGGGVKGGGGDGLSSRRGAGVCEGTLWCTSGFWDC